MVTAVLSQRQSQPSQSRMMVLMILAAVFLWGFGPLELEDAALLTIGGLFCFGLGRPVWAMGALLLSQLTIASYMVDLPIGMTVSLRLLLLVVLALLVFINSARQPITFGPGVRRVLVPACLLVGTAAVANVTNSGLNYAFKDFRNMLVGLLIIFCLVGVIRTVRDLKFICGIVFVGVMASAVIAVMQHYQMAGMDEKTLLPGALNSRQGRVPGIAETELNLAYVLSAALLALLGVYLVRGVKADMRPLMLVSIACISLALYFTYTRSALLAVLLGAVAFILFMKTRVRGGLILGIMLGAVLFISTSGVMEDYRLSGRTEEGQVESSISRKIVWQAGMAAVADNPILGIGGDRFAEVSVEYLPSVDADLLAWEEEQYWGFKSLGSTDAHNDFLGVWVSYGTIALIAYLWLYLAALRNLIYSHRRSANRFVKGLAVGLAAGLVVYGTNAFYHNFLAALPLLWILVGLSAATANLARKHVARRDMPSTDSGQSGARTS